MLAVHFSENTLVNCRHRHFRTVSSFHTDEVLTAYLFQRQRDATLFLVGSIGRYSALVSNALFPPISTAVKIAKLFPRVFLCVLPSIAFHIVLYRLQVVRIPSRREMFAPQESNGSSPTTVLKCHLFYTESEYKDMTVLDEKDLAEMKEMKEIELALAQRRKDRDLPATRRSLFHC